MYDFGIKGSAYKHVSDLRLFTPGTLCNVKDISLMVPRRGLCAFQSIVWSDEDFLLTVTDNPLFHKEGPLDIIRMKVELEGIPSDNIGVQLIGLVEDDDRNMKADILLDCEYIHVQGKTAQAIWVEIKVPAHTCPGTYNGVVKFFRHKMFCNEELESELTFQITVAPVTLPPPSEYNFYLDLWQHTSNIARKHGVTLWTDKHFAIIEEYVKTLGELGQKAVTVIASEIPWSGQRSHRDLIYTSDFFEYSMIRVRKSTNGRFHLDFSPMDRYIQLCQQYGIEDEIEVFGLVNIWTDKDAGYSGVVDYIDDIRIRYLDEATGTYKFMKTQDELEFYIKELEAHFIEKGWMDKVRVVADEPADTQLYRDRLTKLKAIAPSFKFKAAINHIEMLEEEFPDLVDFVPVFQFVCTYWERLDELKERVSGRFCWYVCCSPPLPNTYISSPLVESRLIPILTYYMGLDGFLRWNYTVWPEEPLRRMSYRYPRWDAGETNFVYPGAHARPLLTLRYKNLLKGIQDYQLLIELKKTNSEYQSIIEKAFDFILKEKELDRYHPQARTLAGELYSLEEVDYDKFTYYIINALIEGK